MWKWLTCSWPGEAFKTSHCSITWAAAYVQTISRFIGPYINIRGFLSRTRACNTKGRETKGCSYHENVQCDWKFGVGHSGIIIGADDQLPISGMLMIVRLMPSHVVMWWFGPHGGNIFFTCFQAEYNWMHVRSKSCPRSPGFVEVGGSLMEAPRGTNKGKRVAGCSSETWPKEKKEIAFARQKHRHARQKCRHGTTDCRCKPTLLLNKPDHVLDGSHLRYISSPIAIRSPPTNDCMKHLALHKIDFLKFCRCKN